VDIVPGIYLGVRLAVSIQALVIEGRRGTQAMGRSWELWFLQAIAAAVATTVTLPFGALVGVLLYLDLRARTERLGHDGVLMAPASATGSAAWSMATKLSRLQRGLTLACHIRTSGPSAHTEYRELDLGWSALQIRDQRPVSKDVLR
jgi:hypothetical protein